MHTKRAFGLILLLGAIVALGWAVLQRWHNESPGSQQTPNVQQTAAPVEVATIERGEISLKRTFSGTLRATAEFAVAPKISGRIVQLNVDLADPVKRGQVIATLDQEEYVQNVAQAQAELDVTRANLVEAKSKLDNAERTLSRVSRLRQRGVASESQLDEAKADQLAKHAQVKVANAQLHRARAALKSAQIRLGYAQVTADWTGGDVSLAKIRSDENWVIKQS